MPGPLLHHNNEKALVVQAEKARALRPPIRESTILLGKVAYPNWQLQLDRASLLQEAARHAER